MPSVHGSKAKVLWNGNDLTSYGREVGVDGSADVAETTVFGKTSKVYVPGLKDGTLSASGIYDAATGASAQVLEALLGLADSKVIYLPEGDAVGKRGSGLCVVNTQFAVSSPVDDVVTWATEAQSRVGVEPVAALTPFDSKSVSTVAINGTAVDNAASSAAGASAYLEMGAISVATTVKVQHSPDNTAWTDLLTFTQVSATGDNSAQRVTVAGTVNRYLRFSAVATASGTATFLVAVSRTPNNV